ncbi:hypothetical protein B0A49_10623 [Cryomyces minteri]|uniref:Pathogen-related protein n=1 Tax=Cryomyces minteri TaxID=331657 RepID=A0A4U0X376_9PEZI|nr:hypothetical protein B0A49_10623 [Cryomyces minteri]
MAAAEVQAPPAEPAPALPDYLASPDAVLGDDDAKWRYGRAPDYSKTRAVFAETKRMNHAAGSLPELVENLVKNWEVEASFKPRLSDWRTVDHANYTFAINGGPPQSAEHMLKVGTYNAILVPNEYYSPDYSDFASSHKTFKRMMPTFAWEVLEVYGGPPQVAFRWRHWGTMKNDYVGFNDKGEKVTAKAHGGSIDIEGVTVAVVDDKVRLQKVETWFDPLQMFRQIAPNGVVNKEIVEKKVENAAVPPPIEYNDGVRIAEHSQPDGPTKAIEPSDMGRTTTEEAHQKSDSGKVEPSANNEGRSHITASAEESGEYTTEHETFHDASQETEGHVENTPQPATETVEPVDQAEKLVRAAETSAADMSTESVPPNIEEKARPAEVKSRSSSQSSGSAWEKVSHPDSATESPANLPYQSASPTGAEKDQIQMAETGEHTSESVMSGAEAPNIVDHIDYSATSGKIDEVDQHLEKSADTVHPHPKNMEEAVRPEAGEAVVAPAASEETRLTYEEMSRITPMECPFLMNRE